MNGQPTTVLPRNLAVELELNAARALENLNRSQRRRVLVSAGKSLLRGDRDPDFTERLEIPMSRFLELKLLGP